MAGVLSVAGRVKRLSISHIAIIGAGFSGSLLAINLLRHDGPDATLIERGPAFAKGTAYTTRHAAHLLNVRAGNMSAFPDDPDHFVRWLGRRGLGEASSFVPRSVYGSYLAELLAETAKRAAGRLKLIQGEAVGIDVSADAAAVTLADGRLLDVDAAVVALGNLPPHAPPGFDPDRLGPDRYVADPWAGPVGDGLRDGDSVLLLGTGLTMVDVALALVDGGFRGRILALSRRGLIPRPHGPAGSSGDLKERPTTRASQLLRAVRARADTDGWRAAVDELRPHTQRLWRAASHAERARFLRHLRPWWDVHRHRLAPEVAARIKVLVGTGMLTVYAGKLMQLDPVAEGVRVGWRSRGSAGIEQATVRRVVNCTGPQGDLARSPEPLLQNLLRAGRARADAFGLGLDVDDQSRLVDAAGLAQPQLYAVGPMTRGAFWEITAVPDIRQQVWSLARTLSNAHWVEGEGL